MRRRGQAVKLTTDPALADDLGRQKPIRWPPMFTADGKPIKTGELIYTLETNLGKYTSRKERYMRAVPHRVIRVDNRYRTVRMRCARGCEDFLQFNRGCSMDGYYSTEAGALRALEEMRAHEVKEQKRGIGEIEERMRHTQSLKIEIGKMPAPHVEAD